MKSLNRRVAMRRLVRFLFLSLGFAAMTSQLHAEHLYDIKNLNPPGRLESRALGINSYGEVVGWSKTTGGEQLAFLYSGSDPDDLPTFGGNESAACGINDNGEIVGYSKKNDGIRYSFFFSESTFVELGGLGEGDSRALAVNRNGVIVGYSYNNDGGYRGVVYRKEDRPEPEYLWMPSAELPTLWETNPSSCSYAYSINDSDSIVGFVDADTAHGGGRPTVRFELDFNESPPLCTIDNRGTLGGLNAAAYGINSIGQIVGYSQINVEGMGLVSHAFLLEPGDSLTDDDHDDDLGTLGGKHSWANAINSTGQIVGRSWTGSTSDTCRAFVCSGSTMDDLNNLIPPDSGWILSEAMAINDRGQIVGYGTYDDGTYVTTRAFLLTPVPEPSVWALLTGLAIFGLLGGAVRRR